MTTAVQSCQGRSDGSHLDLTGALEVDTLGYGLVGEASHGDSVYHLNVTIPHSASSIVLGFTGSGPQGKMDEAWGIDNVSVAERSPGVPEPSLSFGLIPGLLMLGYGFRRVRRS